MPSRFVHDLRDNPARLGLHLELVQQHAQGGHHWSSITGHAEIGPVEVIMGPRRIPLRVEIQTEIAHLGRGA